MSLDEREELVDIDPRRVWESEYDRDLPAGGVIRNRSGLEIKPLYSEHDWAQARGEADGYPGQFPFTRGIYPTMYRGKRWSQRQLVGLGTPADYNGRVLQMIDSGANAISLLPCNSVFRGLDCDQAPLPLLGTCGTVINTVDHMDRALEGVSLEHISTAMNDPTPFTLLAFLLGTAKRRGVPASAITGTSNQSDYISHYVANHMFYRLSQTGARRIFTDHVAYCREILPRWNPVSIVGQHMQQAGATPAETMAFTLSSAIQYARDCEAAGLDLDDVLPRFTFFFDISISFFEEIAKFRAGRRIWARIARDQLGAKDPRSWRFKFHGQTSGVDLTVQQPLNNIARVTTQAVAGIFSGLQSMHTDAYDEAITCPTEETARIAVATQNILREEAHLCDVIDPLAGSYYVETLTDEMEAEILRIMALIEDAGGMYEAVGAGLVQNMIGRSALAAQDLIESGAEKIVGVNCYETDESEGTAPEPYRADPEAMQQHVDSFRKFKAERSNDAVRRALDALNRAADSKSDNIFVEVVNSADQGVTHGEIVEALRDRLGFGHPLIVA